MPTTVTKTVKSAGGDYTSLSAWEAGEQANLVTLDEIRQAECYSFEDTTPVSISGWTTSATQYIRIFTPSAERHDGEWNASKYRLVCNTSNSLGMVDSHVSLEGIQVRMNSPTDFSGHTAINVGSGAICNIDRCIIYGNATAGGQNFRGVDISTFGGLATVKVQNCGFFSVSAGGSTVFGFKDSSSSASSTAHVYNCTFKNFKVGVSRDSLAAVHLKNCGFVNCTTRSTGTLASDTTNSTTTPTFDTGKEFHLASGDSTWKDQGTDLSADGGSINSLDIDGETRSGTWDIGADEVSVAAGAISGSTTLTFTPSGQIQGAGDLAGATSLTFTPTAAIQGLVALAGSSSLTFSVTGGITGLGIITGASTLTFTATGGIVGSGTLSGTSTLIFSPAAAISGSGELAGASSLIFSPTGSVISVGAMAGSATLTFIPTGAVVGFGGLAGSTTLIFAVTGLLEDGGLPGSISGSAVLSFAATGTLSAFGALSGSTTLSFTASGTPTIEEIEEPEPPKPQLPQAVVCGTLEFDENIEVSGSLEFDENMEAAGKLEFDENIGECLPK